MSLLDLFAPIKCPYCGKKIKRNQPSCSDCAVKTTDGYILKKLINGRCVAPFSYNGMYKKAIYNYKFKNKPQHRFPFSVEIAKTVNTAYKDLTFDCVTFVPMNSKPQQKRGYNQAQLLAQATAKQLNLPCKELLVKTKVNEQQHTLPKEQRAANVNGVFAVNKKQAKYIKDKKVLIVDDISTTGSTLNECMAVLHKGGALEICGATFAIVK